MPTLNLDSYLKPRIIVLTPAEFEKFITQYPEFARIIELLGLDKDYFSSPAGKEKVSRICDSLQMGTCDVQTQFLTRMFLENPTLTDADLGKLLEQNISRLIDYLAIQRFIEKTNPNIPELFDILKSIIYKKETIEATQPSDGYLQTL